LGAVEIGLVFLPRAVEVVARELVVQEIEALAPRRDDAVSDGLAGRDPERVAEGLELFAVLGRGALTIRSAQPLQDVLAAGRAEPAPVVARLRAVGAGTARGDKRDRQRQACRETYRHGHPPGPKRRATGRHCVS